MRISDWSSYVCSSELELPQPVIACIRGHCYTGGLELALAADIIIAARSAKFVDTHSKWGLSPLWGMTQRLPRRVGLDRKSVVLGKLMLVRVDLGGCRSIKQNKLQQTHSYPKTS